MTRSYGYLFLLLFLSPCRCVAVVSRTSCLQAAYVSDDVPEWERPAWEERVRASAASRDGGMVVLVTGGAGFVGFHTSLALRKRGDGVVGIDNFNDYYPVALKRAREEILFRKGM